MKYKQVLVAVPYTAEEVKDVISKIWGDDLSDISEDITKIVNTLNFIYLAEEEDATIEDLIRHSMLLVKYKKEIVRVLKAIR